jgi:hypothetical protein
VNRAGVARDLGPIAWPVLGVQNVGRPLFRTFSALVDIEGLHDFVTVVVDDFYGDPVSASMVGVFQVNVLLLVRLPDS